MNNPDKTLTPVFRNDLDEKEKEEEQDQEKKENQANLTAQTLQTLQTPQTPHSYAALPQAPRAKLSQAALRANCLLRPGARQVGSRSEEAVEWSHASDDVKRFYFEYKCFTFEFLEQQVGDNIDKNTDKSVGNSGLQEVISYLCQLLRKKGFYSRGGGGTHGCNTESWFLNAMQGVVEGLTVPFIHPPKLCLVFGFDACVVFWYIPQNIDETVVMQWHLDLKNVRQTPESEANSSQGRSARSSRARESAREARRREEGRRYNGQLTEDEALNFALMASLEQSRTQNVAANEVEATADDNNNDNNDALDGDTIGISGVAAGGAGAKNADEPTTQLQQTEATNPQTTQTLGNGNNNSNNVANNSNLAQLGQLDDPDLLLALQMSMEFQ